MKEEFNLSDKIHDVSYYSDRTELIYTEDVKEFIRLILLDLDFLDNPNWREAYARIQKRAGDKLK